SSASSTRSEGCSPTSRAEAASDCISAGRSSSTSAARCGWKATLAGARAFPSCCRPRRRPPGASLESSRAHMTKRVLIADDEPNIVAALEYLLQQGGYEVLVARNGDEALALLDQRVPDLVLLDVMMPRKSGYEICSRIRNQPEWRHIKVIMLSAK